MSDEICSSCGGPAELVGDINSAPYTVWRVCKTEQQCGHREFVSINEQTALFDSQIIPLMKFAEGFMQFARRFSSPEPGDVLLMDMLHTELKEALVIP